MPAVRRDGRKKGIRSANPRSRTSGRTVLIVLAVISVISVASYYALQTGLRPGLGRFTSQAVAMFIGVLVVPGIFLALGLPSRKGLALGKLDPGFIITFLVYQVFAIWIILFFSVDPEYFKDYSIGSNEHLWYIALVGIYVPPVDFFTRRVIQLEVASEYGDTPAFYIATIAWVLGHIPEFFWLSELMGPVGSPVFLIVSGLVSGLLYMRYKNALALMLGHWMINIIVSSVTSAMH